MVGGRVDVAVGRAVGVFDGTDDVGVFVTDAVKVAVGGRDVLVTVGVKDAVGARTVLVAVGMEVEVDDTGVFVAVNVTVGG